ncbi:MAG: hypothetical protein GWN37_12645 [Gammaproteobacteria bacterium]|nr:hypothetical protein [Gammaproteobacteria bacterium]
MAVRWKEYEVDGLYDELMLSGGRPRRAAASLVRYLASLSDQELASVQAASKLSVKETGVTFTVYTQEEGSIDRAWPFDIIPRIMARAEWERIEAARPRRLEPGED